MMYLFLKAEPSPDAPYQLLFVTVTESGGGWVSLYSGENGQALVLEQNEFPTLEAAIGRGIEIREELQKNGSPSRLGIESVSSRSRARSSSTLKSSN
jgi:hypothetical protein